MSKYQEVLYSKSQINRAGKLYCQSSSEIEKQSALVLINNWRAAHAFPLQILYCHVKKVSGGNAIVAQRLKRLQSITKKLERFPHMALCTMQDIGGCRIIVSTNTEVYAIVERLKKSRMRHRLKEEYDYIQSPKEDGYRSYHLSFSYQSDCNIKYNGLFIEIQIRTHIQHLWATAVETMDIFTGEALKNGSGSDVNKRFFQLASQLLQIYEDSNNNVDMVKRSDTAKEMQQFDSEHHIINRLAMIRASIQEAQNDQFSSEGYYLLSLNIATNTLSVEYFMPICASEATKAYDEKEKSKTDSDDVVLVSTLSYDALQKAYPNYFSDIAEFHELMQSFVQDESLE